jgi:L-fuconate dehydratase
VNAIWDLWAKSERKPLWQLVCDLSPAEIVRCIDFRYLTDVLTPRQAEQMLADRWPTRHTRQADIQRMGYPAYTTSVGWLGYSDDRLRQLCRQAVRNGWNAFKVKVGRDQHEDVRRLQIVREEIGPTRKLMLDANQIWDVDEAIASMRVLARFDPLWIEEPTSPDDVLGHARIAKAIAPIGVASGEAAHNRVIFKQFLQAGGIQFCQIDSCRLGGVNEVLAVLLMAAKFGVPVCPHGGGVGLCEHIQHLCFIDYLCISGELALRYAEYVDHLHEHFVQPVDVRRGRYFPPTRAGYSVEMRQVSIDQFRYPDGSTWRGHPPDSTSH